MRLQDMLQARRKCTVEIENVLFKAGNENRALTQRDQADLVSLRTSASELDTQIKEIEAKNTIIGVLRNNPADLMGAGRSARPSEPTKEQANQAFSQDYVEAFHSYITSSGRNVSAALYEGSNAGGGYAVPITVADMIVPLAAAEIGVREVATVIPTAMDIKVPIKSAFGTGVAIKTESGSSAHLFAESDPSLGQFTLSAFMLGGVSTMSFEIAQDINTFQTFVMDDLLKSIAVFEDGKFLSGSGTGEPQGLLGNTGAGVTGVVADGSGNLLPNTALFDVTGTLNAVLSPWSLLVDVACDGHNS